MREATDESLDSRNESARRLTKLNVVVGEIVKSLEETELKKVRAIVLYGSTARGEARETSDIDIHIDLDPPDLDLLKKIIYKFRTAFPGVEFSFSSKKIVVQGGLMSKTITAQKDPDKPASWRILYSRDETSRGEIEGVLSETQRKYRKTVSSVV